MNTIVFWCLVTFGILIWMGAGYFAFIYRMSLDYYHSRLVSGSNFEHEDIGGKIALSLGIVVLCALMPVVVYSSIQTHRSDPATAALVRRYGLLFTATQARQVIARVESEERAERYEEAALDQYVQ